MLLEIEEINPVRKETGLPGPRWIEREIVDGDLSLSTAGAAEKLKRDKRRTRGKMRYGVYTLNTSSTNMLQHESI